MLNKIVPISILALLCMAIFVQIPFIQAAPTNKFGNTVVGANSNELQGTKDAIRFSLYESGVIESISVYFANSGFNAKAAIYADSPSGPGQLIAQSSSQWVASPGWQTFAVSQKSLSPGYYWLSSAASVYWASGVKSSGSSQLHFWVGSSYTSEFTSSFGTPIGKDYGVPSIYATYTTSAATPAPSTPTSTSSSSSGSIEIGAQIYATRAYSTSDTAKYFDLWVGHWDAVAELAVPAKQARSDFKALLYGNILYRYSTGTNDPAGTFNTFKNNGWLLRNSQGNYIIGAKSNEYILDFGNPSVWNWYANWLKGIVFTNNLDGAYLDNLVVNARNAFYYASVSGAVNPRTGTTWTDAQVLSAYIGFVNTIKYSLGSDKIVLGNGIYNGNPNHFEQSAIQQLISQTGIDGIASEGWMGHSLSLSWPSETNWVNSVNMAVWIQTNLLAIRSKGIFMPITACASTIPDYGPGYLNGVSSKQYITFVYTSLLMAATYNGNHLSLGTTDTYTQNLFNINLGTPNGNYYIVSGTHVYARDFTNAKVLVNPTASSYTVYLSGSYRTQDGYSVSSSINVPAHSGVILTRS